MQKRQTLTKLLPAALICAAVLSPAGAAEAKNEITVAVASTFTTMDPVERDGHALSGRGKVLL